jgi:hypothetical protein
MDGQARMTAGGIAASSSATLATTSEAATPGSFGQAGKAQWRHHCIEILLMAVG